LQAAAIVNKVKAVKNEKIKPPTKAHEAIGRQLLQVNGTIPGPEHNELAGRLGQAHAHSDQHGVPPKPKFTIRAAEDHEIAEMRRVSQAVERPGKKKKRSNVLITHFDTGGHEESSLNVRLVSVPGGEGKQNERLVPSQKGLPRRSQADANLAALGEGHQL